MTAHESEHQIPDDVLRKMMSRWVRERNYPVEMLTRREVRRALQLTGQEKTNNAYRQLRRRLDRIAQFRHHERESRRLYEQLSR